MPRGSMEVGSIDMDNSRAGPGLSSDLPSSAPSNINGIANPQNHVKHRDIMTYNSNLDSGKTPTADSKHIYSVENTAVEALQRSSSCLEENSSKNTALKPVISDQIHEKCTTTCCSSPTNPISSRQEQHASENGIAILDDPSRFPEGGKQAYLVLLGSFLGLTGVLAFVNTAGVIENYISQNILPDTPTSTIGWIFSINSFLSFGMTLISGPMFDRVGCRIPISIGTLLMVLGYMCTSVSTEVYQFILAYGVVAGLGTAFTFGPFVGVISHFFLRKRAMAIGSAYIGGAVGGVVFPIMFRSLLPKIGFGWTIRIGGFICLALLLAGLALVRDRHTEFHLADPSNTDSIVTQIVKSIDFKVFKNKVYSCLVLALLGNGFAFLITLVYLPSYATAFGYPEKEAYLLLVTFNAFSIPGRILPSLFADRYGRFNLVCIISMMSTLGFFILWVNRPVGHTLTGLFVFSGWYGFSSGSMLSLSPAAIGQIVRVEDIGKCTGTAFFVLSFGDLVGIPVGGAITNAKTRASFDHLVLFVAFCSVCGTIGSCGARYLYAGFRIVKV